MENQPQTVLPTDFVVALHSHLSDDDVSQLVNTIDEHKKVTSIRLHNHKTCNFSNKDLVPWCPNGRYLDERPSFIFDPNFHAGCYYVQEASSMILWQVLSQCLNHELSPIILDLCASPGGKSTLIATYLDGEGFLVCNEVIKKRSYTLKYNLSKEGYTNTMVTNNDPKEFSKIDRLFDMIVIDAPCSGEGMFRKDSKAISEWSLENVNLCSARQKRIVADVLPSLKDEGYLVYSTCTYNDRENIENIEWMIQSFDLEIVNLNVDSSWGISKIEKSKAVGYQFYPHKSKGEGFFISVLRKKKKNIQNDLLNVKDKTFATPTKVQQKELSKWVKEDAREMLLIDKATNIHAISKDFVDLARHLSNSLHIISTGVSVGNFNKDILIPDHGFALSFLVNPAIPRYELTLKDSLTYLKKELGYIESSRTSWQIATYQNNAIGWFKNLGNRINNYLPNELRILKNLDSS